MMQTERFFLFIIILVLYQLTAFSQTEEWDDEDIIRHTNEADGYFIYDENYEAAAVIYEKILELKPGDHNTNYKLGVCYLNITGKKKEALKLLEYASTGYVEDHEYSTLGESAPFDVLYYLAFAYQINMKLKKAVEYYKKYENLLRVREVAEIEYINLQIKACMNALNSADTSKILKKKLFSPWLTSFHDVVNPVISANDSVFAFTIEKRYENHIFCSYKTTDGWSEPEDITENLGRKNDMYTNSITGDGKSLIIARNDGIHGDIYISHYNKGKWSKIDKFGREINTKYWESHGCISQDGTKLYFASNKPEGYGSLDLYVAELDERFKAGRAKNLGPVVNTRLEENTPYYIDSTSVLYFSSTGHEGFGGYDIYYSTNSNKRWSQPIHMPYPINTTSDDLNYIPYNSSGLMSIQHSDTSSYRNIFLVEIDKRPEDRKILAAGEINLDDGMEVDSTNLNLTLLAESDSLQERIKPDSSGFFSLELTSGKYKLTASYPGYISDTMIINIPESFDRERLYLTKNLISERVASGEFLAIRNILFDFDKSTLDRKAKIEIEKIIPVLLSHPDLNICIEGFTDAIGSNKYNLNLSEKRAREVQEYLTDAGISIERISIIPRGESFFIADNSNPDGTDNPEGRKYNRRVSICIENNGYSIPVESYLNVPGHLKKPYAYSFHVVLTESEYQVSPSCFSDYNRSEFAFVNELKTENKYLYTLGGFPSKLDAITYLVDIVNLGFEEAYIISEYDMPGSDIEKAELPEIYTIQIHALKNKRQKPFRNLDKVNEIIGNDGFYRYTVGEYKGYTRASQALKRIQDLGYETAFIKPVVILEQQTLPNNLK